MQLHVDDDGFVRAPRGLVYRRLTDVGAWPVFWPNLRVAPVTEGPDAFRLSLPRAGWRGSIDLMATAHGWRHDEGFRLRLQGDLVGDAEFWLEEGWGGTVVHHLASLDVPGRGPRSVARAYRAALRSGLCGLKDDLQGEVRERLGLAR